ncbi:unnamed protein product [Heterosigma akashiwo]
MACKSYLSFLLAALFVMNVCCFVSNGPTHHQASSARKQARTAIRMMESRRNFLVQAGLSTGLLVNTMKSDAKVYFEIDKYGDKELKIGTVNKLNQNLRNAMGKDPTLIPAFFRLALYDGLNYVAASNLGGLDGKLDPRLRELDPAAGRALGEALAIKARLQRTNELSLADVIAFGGAQAIECVGGPKIVVQLGRTDNQKVQESRPLAALGTADFQRSGLGASEGVLLLAAGRARAASPRRRWRGGRRRRTRRRTAASTAATGPAPSPTPSAASVRSMAALLARQSLEPLF